MPDFLAIFDVDGTLIDSAAVIVATVDRAFAASGVPGPAPDRIRARIGLSLPLMIAGLAEGVPEAVVGRIVADYKLGFAAMLEA
ncbi:MAG: HAD hydrolase-like protein, partial [Jannaschia sp.]